jgi:hypothetical protein
MKRCLWLERTRNLRDLLLSCIALSATRRAGYIRRKQNRSAGDADSFRDESIVGVS